MNLVYKKIEEKDKEQLFKLIDTVLGELENQEYFIPYERWELDSMFDEKNYAPLYGAYNQEKLVGMAHPDNVSSQKTLEKVGLKYVKETRLSNVFLRKLYMLKLK